MKPCPLCFEEIIMKTHRVRYMWLLAVVLTALPVLGQVGGVPGISSVSNRVDVIQPPANLDSRVSGDGDAVVFLERENLTLDESLRVDITETGRYSLDSIALSPGRISRGTEINSYLIHFDPDSVRNGNLASILPGEVTFAEEILGVITVTSTLNSTTDRLGAPATDYQTMSGLEFERVDLGPKDEIFFEANRRTIRFEFRDETEIDQMRVITVGSSVVNNIGPNARGDEVTTRENGSITIDVLSNDSGINDNFDLETLRVTSGPSDGTASVNRDDDTITYDPESNFTGTDSFVYEICDLSTRCDSATVQITVEAMRSSGGGDGDLTLRTLLPEADDCSFAGEARIDISPGNRVNLIRMDDEMGHTAVAILSTVDFPAPNCVDISTASFGPTGDEAAAVSCGVANVNFDRWDDVVCDFKTSELGFLRDDESGRLEAVVIDGGFIAEEDDVEVRGTRRIRSRIPEGLSSPVDVVNVVSQKLGSSLWVRASGADVAGVSIQVFNGDGQLVARDVSSGPLLRWNMKSRTGAILANGIYIYVVTALDADGKVIGRAINKIALVR